MQERLGKGEFNRATTRVLHMVNNPEAQTWQDAHQRRVEELEASNSLLRTQLQRLEEHLSGAGTTAPDAAQVASAALTDAEIIILKRKARPLREFSAISQPIASSFHVSLPFCRWRT